MPALSPQAIWRGNPASDTHEANPSEIVTWAKMVESNNSPVLYGVRDADGAEAMASRMLDGEVGIMGGLPYTKQSALTGAASVTNDLGVDGLNYAGVLSVAHLGATGDGDETDIFQLAIDALPANGGTIILEDDVDYTVTVSSLNAGSKRIVWLGGATVNTLAVWGLPGTQQGFVFTDTYARMFYNKQDGAALDGSYMDFRRNADYVGGNGGDLDYIATFRTTVGANVGSAGNRKAEKAVLFRVDSFSAHANSVAVFAAAFAEAQGAVWAGEYSTHSKVTPATYAHRSVEMNIHGYGADPNNLRWILNIAAHNETQVYSGTPGTDEVGVGLEIYPDSADLNYGIRIRTQPAAGTTKGIIQEAALRIDTSDNDLIQAISDTTGLVRFGSSANSGIVTQILGVGNNSLNQSVAYTDIRSQISSNVDGAEDGILKLEAIQNGTMTEFFRINAGAGNPIQLRAGGTLKDVTEGAADTGGAGFRALVVPN